jgi:hypothetical protein
MSGTRRLTAAVLAVALLLASATPALAVHRGKGRGARAPYKVAKPRVVSNHVAVGAAFEATGVIVPAIAADDASASVAIAVYRPGKRGRLVLVSTVPATLSSLSETVTAYSGTVTLPAVGSYRLVAVVSRDGVGVARSEGRPVFAVPPYRIGKARLASPKVTMGVSFEASGVIMPAIALDDVATTVAVSIYRLRKKGAPVLVGSADAALSSVSETVTAYTASITLPESGDYALVAVVSRDGLVLARSTARRVCAALAYKVARPRLERRRVTAGAAFDATGVVVPGIAADDLSTTVEVRVYKLGRHGRRALVDTVGATLTGPAGEGTAYSASVTIAERGTYVLVAVVVRGGVAYGRSSGRELRVFRAIVPETGGSEI